MCFMAQGICSNCHCFILVFLERCEDVMLRQPSLDHVAVFEVKNEMCWSPFPGCDSLAIKRFLYTVTSLCMHCKPDEVRRWDFCLGVFL